MKTPEQILEARECVSIRLAIPALSMEQRCLLAGMSTALNWMMDSPNGDTLDRLLSGEPVAAGRRHTDLTEKEKSLAPIFFRS